MTFILKQDVENSHARTNYTLLSEVNGQKERKLLTGERFRVK